jgi:AraC-like DNA-binding protein
VEGRRKVRPIFAGAIGACIVLTTLSGALGATLLPAITAVLCVALAAALLRLRVEQPALVPIPRPPAPADTLDQQDQRLAERLRTVMDQERAYREAGLTIASLAERLNVPEYRLRRLINQRLGHRNFVTYVNGFRLTEARQALADPAQVRVPVLTIALDAGFQSIGPFNRAFKALTGATPTEYRRRSLADPGIGQDLQG